MPRQIIIKLPKIKGKERILKPAGEKETVAYNGVPIRLSADFPKETLQARRGQKEIFKSHEKEGPIPKITLSFRMEDLLNCSSDKVKLKEFIISRPLLYEML